jgi:hypothetical protein
MVWLGFMVTMKNGRILEKYTMCSATLCSGLVHRKQSHFARFVCSHSYCYAFRRIVQTDSLSHEETYLAQNPAFLQNTRVKEAGE